MSYKLILTQDELSWCKPFNCACVTFLFLLLFFFFQAEDGIRDADVTGVQTCALPILDFFPSNIRLFTNWVTKVSLNFGSGRITLFFGLLFLISSFVYQFFKIYWLYF